MSWHILKDCENSLCSQEQEEVSSEAISWDGERFAPSNGPTILGGYCLPDSETGSCPDSRSGTMCRLSTAISGEAESMSSQADSHARTSAQPAKGQELKALDLECGFTWQGSLARYDRDLRLWKTPQCSLLEGLDEFSETWPRWGMMRNGECWERPMLAPRIIATEYGSWPTPVKTDGLAVGWCLTSIERKERGETRPSGAHIGTGLKYFRKTGQYLTGGYPNPKLTEWLMGWPASWTDLQPQETAKFQQWRQQHSGF